jgi:hypothetical protein
MLKIRTATATSCSRDGRFWRQLQTNDSVFWKKFREVSWSTNPQQCSAVCVRYGTNTRGLIDDWWCTVADKKLCAWCLAMWLLYQRKGAWRDISPLLRDCQRYCLVHKNDVSGLIFVVRQYLLYLEWHVGRSRKMCVLFGWKNICWRIKIVKLNNMAFWKTSLRPIKIYQITRRHNQMIELFLITAMKTSDLTNYEAPQYAASSRLSSFLPLSTNIHLTPWTLLSNTISFLSNRNQIWHTE